MAVKLGEKIVNGMDSLYENFSSALPEELEFVHQLFCEAMMRKTVKSKSWAHLEKQESSPL